MSVNEIAICSNIVSCVSAKLLNRQQKPLLFWKLRSNQPSANPKDGEIATVPKGGLRGDY